MNPGERAALRAHLLQAGLAGATATPRGSVVGNAEKLAAGDPDKRLGIGARGRSAEEVLRVVADLCGCDPSLDIREGPGDIDPERTLDGLQAVGDRLAAAVTAGEHVLIATGHPTGVMPMYQAVARALVEAGVVVPTPADDVEIPAPRKVKRPRRIRYLDRVAVLATVVDLLHTHESWPMDTLLDRVTPDLVLADHGFAGAAIARGVETMSFTDVNDPAIAVAWADGLTSIVVPIDDNRAPATYEPLAAYLVGRVVAAGGRNG